MKYNPGHIGTLQGFSTGSICKTEVKQNLISNIKNL